MITVTIDTSDLTRKLEDFPEALARAQQNALKVIGNVVKNHTTDAFTHPEYRPSPWAPRKPSKRDDGHKLLIKSGDLQQNFRSVVTGPDTVVVGTKVEYAGYHQFGTKHMPARPFFPIDEHGQLTPTVQRDIKDNVEAIYKKEIDKVFGNGGG